MTDEQQTNETGLEPNPAKSEAGTAAKDEKPTEAIHSLSEEIADAVQEGEPGQATAF